MGFVVGCGKKGVQFADQNLEMAIRDAIRKSEGAIRKSDLEGLVHLRARRINIAELNGIEHCINLQFLDLDGNRQIIDISPLSKLTKLRHLDLDANQIIDISPLSRLTNLQDLSLIHNPVIDISPLSNLTNLQALSLRGILLDDISPLGSLTNLQRLSLGKTKVSDIGTLAKLTDLRALYLTHNWITDISALKVLTKIGGKGGWESTQNGISLHLYLSYNQIEDISSLVDNPGIGRGDGIELQGNPLNDEAYEVHIPALEERGVNVLFDPNPEEWEGDEVSEKKIQRCSFCGKSKDEARKLVAGSNDVFICDECVEVCSAILADELDEP